MAFGTRTFTIAQDWNARAGAMLFAESVDEFGLPSGGWGLPHLEVTAPNSRDRSAGRLRVGCFRVSPAEPLNIDRVAMERQILEKDVLAARGMRDVVLALIDEFIELVRNFEATNAS